MKKQQEELFVAFIRQHKEPLYRLAYSYVKNEQDALDIMQDSIHKAWKALPKLREHDQLKSWFYQILVRTAIDFLRKHQRTQVVDDETIEYVSPKQVDTYVDMDMQTALAHLPIVYREVVILRYFEDLKLEDVASLLCIPLSTAKSRLYKALKLLKIELQEEDEIHE